MQNRERTYLLTAAALFCAMIAALFLIRTKFGLIQTWEPHTTTKPVQYSSDAFINGRLNINAAPVEYIRQLPGIGQTLAERIIEYRENNGPYTNTIEIILVEGVSQEKFDRIKYYITVGD